MNKKISAISLILAISLIILPYFQLALAKVTNDESFYNSNQVLFYNDKYRCVDNELSLSGNLAVGDNDSGLSKKIMKINDPDRFAQAIDDWIASKQPNSPLKGLGKYAVAGGQRVGINPILPIIIAQKESSLATAGSLHSRAFNSFGRTATKSQPHIGTSRLWYRWNSYKQSLYSSDPNYTDMYQYLARVYQAQDTIEEVMFKYAPPKENNTTLYIRQIKNWAGEIYRLAGDSIEVAKFGSKNEYNYIDCSTPMSKFGGTLKKMFYQYSPKWASHLFSPSCGNIKDCGCGPTTMAIVFSNLLDDPSITPISITKEMPTGTKLRQGTAFSAFYSLAKKHGLKIKSIGTNMDTARQELSKNKMIIMSQNSNGPFTNGGHIMALIGQTSDGRFLVADPNSKKYTENQQGFSEQTITKGLRAMWVVSL